MATLALNSLVEQVRASVFGFHMFVFALKPKVLTSVLLDFPGLLFFTTYTLLVLFWAEIYYLTSVEMFWIYFSAKSLSTNKLRTWYIAVNCSVYVMQVVLSAFDSDASLEVLDHPVLDLIYYTVVEILPSALVLFILRKLPTKRVPGQYHPIQ